ncbi:MAG: hypothetical protein LBD94_02940 [Rickettsiales bacterium]|nr:hypothetical protein [Rickettsiales bacterium]
MEQDSDSCSKLTDITIPDEYTECSGMNDFCKCLEGYVCAGGDTTCTGSGQCPSNTKYDPAGGGAGKANCYIDTKEIIFSDDNGNSGTLEEFFGTQVAKGSGNIIGNEDKCYYNDLEN